MSTAFLDQVPSSPTPSPAPALPSAPVPASAATPSAPAQSRKRKRAPAAAPSPAPSEPGAASTPAPEVLSSRADLSARPRLSISRGPHFLPTAEGSEFFKTELTGVNRIGYRYTPAGINPPGHFLPCRTIESNPTSYRISWEDRSSFVAVTKDGLGLLGSSGFRSARCNAPVREGRWYMEVKIVRGGGEHFHEDGKREGSHVRVGWGRREAPLNGPVGLDGYSYAMRDATGQKVTLSRPRPYGRSFSTGDVIGMYISLPSKRKANPKDSHDPARTKRERIAIDLKGQEVFEILEYTQSKEMAALMDYSGKSSTSASIPSSKKVASGKLPERGPSNAPKANAANLRPLPVLHDSHIAFFVNGECQGIAFQDLYDYLQLRQTDTSRKAKDRKRTREGVKEHTENPFDDGTLGYYPFISLFNEACVRLNPGPNFDFPPPRDIEALLFDTAESEQQTWRPICERYAEFMAEQWALDAVEEEEASAEAVRHAALEKAQAEKKAQKNKRRQQTEARKRAKIALETTSTIDDDRMGSVASGPGQPSPLRHGTAYIPHTPEPAPRSDDPSYSSPISALDRVHPQRLTTGFEASRQVPSESPSEATSRPDTPHTYAYSPDLPSAMDDIRPEPRSHAALLGPGQPGEGWIPYTPPVKRPTTSSAEELHRPKLLAGPGQPSSPRMAAVYGYNAHNTTDEPGSVEQSLPSSVPSMAK
ncbi:COMPASS complex protein [Favolaschia claudopus]|uniref:COMPASS complex protein n=1 Tax=Favolaschia claudopus TaxID=2862362 RepID=A0AAW0ANU5_9AGAR